MQPPFDENHVPTPPKRGLFASLRASFLTGIVVIAPVGLTIWLIWSVIGFIDGFVLPLVPGKYQPDVIIRDLFGLSPMQQVNIRGIGVVIFLIFTIFVGWVAKGYIGRSLIRWAESLVLRTPVVRSIYSGIKQISETVFAQNERSFEHACLVEYPRRGLWVIGFISTEAKGEIARRPDASSPLMGVFIPTTPNPTSGFLLFVPEDDCTILDMSIEDAAKLIISAGLVYPNGKSKDEVEAALTTNAAPS